MAAKLRPAKLRLLLLLCFQGVAVLQAMDLACVPSIWRHPLSGPYVDLTLYLRPASTPVDSSANTGIRIEIMVYHKDGIRAFDKYVLRKNATTKSDTSSPMTSGDWADLRRFYLPPGRYGLEIRAVSLWDTLDRAVLSKELMVDTPTTGPSLSAPILLHAWYRSSEASRWNRHGFFLMARPDLPYRRTLDTMAFYTEVHLDSTKAGRYLLQYALQDQDGRVVGARQAFSRIPVGKQVHAVLGTWPLADLDPGTYRLVMELKDSTNTTLDQKTVSVVRWRLDGWAKNGLLAVQGRPGDATQDSLASLGAMVDGFGQQRDLPAMHVTEASMRHHGNGEPWIEWRTRNPRIGPPCKILFTIFGKGAGNRGRFPGGWPTKKKWTKPFQCFPLGLPRVTKPKEVGFTFSMDRPIPEPWWTTSHRPFLTKFGGTTKSKVNAMFVLCFTIRIWSPTIMSCCIRMPLAKIPTRNGACNCLAGPPPFRTWIIP